MAIPTKDTLLAPYATNWQTRIATGYATFALTSAQAAAYAAVYTPYINAWTALQEARTSGVRSKEQTSNKDAAKRAMLQKLRELYTLVQASLNVSDGNKDLLGVKVRDALPAPRPAPGAVSNFKVGINADGSITIKWKSDNAGASGTLYQVWRKIGNGDFAYCGGCGDEEVHRPHRADGRGERHVSNTGGAVDGGGAVGAVQRQLRHRRR
jgi:hypothetical protein